jgi:hypothetical protein
VKRDLSREDLTYENKFWVFFGHGEGWEGDRCSRCYELLEKEQKPNKYCINCWKLEIFFSNCTDPDAVKAYFLEEAKMDRTLHGKWIKEEMEIPGALTSIPEEGHPDPGIEKEGVILIYTQSIKERDRRSEKILKDLQERGLYRKGAISSRRGCLNFDELIGPWKEWYNPKIDYPKVGEPQ